MAHLPAMPHFLDHDPADTVGIVVGRRRPEKIALLLDGCELGITLVDDQIQQGVADLLLRNRGDALPLALTAKISEFDLFGPELSVLGFELVVGEAREAKIDVLLPGAEGVDPVVEGTDFSWPWNRPV